VKIGSLFSGYGGLDMGVQAVLGGEVAWHVEFDAAPSKILAHHWPDVPNYGDITQVDFSQVEPVDILTGGFPCQDLSLAGRRAGMRPGTRSGLWADYLKAIDVLRPRLAVIENVRGLLSGCAESDADSDGGPCPRCAGDTGARHAPSVRALGRVLIDLARIGYDARWLGLRAAEAGAPHGRFRVFVLAHPAGERWERGLSGPQAGSSPAALDSATDPAGERWREGWPESTGREGRSAVDLGGTPASADADSGRPEERLWDWTDEGVSVVGEHGGEGVGPWGRYADAIARWESLMGRAAPEPTEEGEKGRRRLSGRFVEWMMGLPAGHVTEAPIARSSQLKALGNGVVPQQAALALRSLLDSTVYTYIR
jgi:DNA (cytosine-5)-methyltransferase 1